MLNSRGPEEFSEGNRFIIPYPAFAAPQDPVRAFETALPPDNVFPIKATIVPPVPEAIPEDESKEPKESMIWNFLCRWIENAKFLGAIPRAAVDYNEEQGIKNFNQTYAIDYDIQLGTLVGNGCGIALAILFHLASKYGGSYRGARISLNPLYRNFKTLASLGLPVGTLLANLLPFLPKGSQKIFTAIFSDILAIGFGLFAIPYWLFHAHDKEKDHEHPEHHDHFAKIGIEGWSKYAKTAIVYGLCLGQAIGAIIAYCTDQNYLFNMAVSGGITSIVCFVGSLILVPLINRHFNKILISSPPDRDEARNNYVRAGITLGIALGSILGYFLFPGLGPAASMLVGAAFASVLLGAACGVLGRYISQYTQTHWHVQKNTDNSWDYAARNLSYMFSFLFSIVGFFVPVPGGTLVGAALGSAVGGVVGWVCAFPMIWVARWLHAVELSAQTVPWTQRIANGANVGSMLGAAIMFIIGMATNPLNAVEYAMLGFSIGGFTGSLLAGLLDRTALHILFGVESNAEPLGQNSNAAGPKGPSLIEADNTHDEPAATKKSHPGMTDDYSSLFETDSEAEEDERNDAVETQTVEDSTPAEKITVEYTVQETAKVVFTPRPTLKTSNNPYRLFHPVKTESIHATHQPVPSIEHLPRIAICA